MTNHNTLILGIDGGGSKTLARLCEPDGQIVAEKVAGPSSLTNNLDSACTLLRRLIDELCLENSVNPTQLHLMAGLAGGGSTSRVKHLLAQLPQDLASVRIATDATTSLYGANNGKPVCIVALGTGSVAARLNKDGTETLQGGWGFIAGDEGSGAKLGLSAVKALLREIDRYQRPCSALGRAIASVTGDSRTQLLGWIAEANPARYAALAPRVLAVADLCAAAQEVVAQHVNAVVNMINDICEGNNYPVTLLGGLASATYAWLPASVQNVLTDPVGTSLDGACWLAKQQLLSQPSQVS